jgi:hypothetical protein
MRGLSGTVSRPQMEKVACGGVPRDVRAGGRGVAGVKVQRTLKHIGAPAANLGAGHSAVQPHLADWHVLVCPLHTPPLFELCWLASTCLAPPPTFPPVFVMLTGMYRSAPCTTDELYWLATTNLGPDPTPSLYCYADRCVLACPLHQPLSTLFVLTSKYQSGPCYTFPVSVFL